MAFDRDGWNPIGGQSRKGTAPAIWSYTTTDAKTVVRVAAYFNNVSDEVQVGDLIYTWANTGGTATAGLNIVLSNASGVVDVSDTQTIPSDDSD